MISNTRWHFTSIYNHQFQNLHECIKSLFCFSVQQLLNLAVSLFKPLQYMEFTLFLDKSGQRFKLQNVRGIDLGAKRSSIDPRVRCFRRLRPMSNLGIPTWASIHDFGAQSSSQVWNTAPVAASNRSHLMIHFWTIRFKDSSVQCFRLAFLFRIPQISSFLCLCSQNSITCTACFAHPVLGTNPRHGTRRRSADRLHGGKPCLSDVVMCLQLSLRFHEISCSDSFLLLCSSAHMTHDSQQK